MKKILCVDDDQDILDSLDIILSKEGHDVEVVSSPNNIFSTIQRFEPDLILLDINMDGYNGLDICKALKSYISTQKIPILIISSDESINTAKEIYGATDIILKPFNLNSLVGTINKYLQTG